MTGWHRRRRGRRRPTIAAHRLRIFVRHVVHVVRRRRRRRRLAGQVFVNVAAGGVGRRVGERVWRPLLAVCRRDGRQVREWRRGQRDVWWRHGRTGALLLLLLVAAARVLRVQQLAPRP